MQTLTSRLKSRWTWRHVVALGVTLAVILVQDTSSDLTAQYLVGARSWPEPYHDVPLTTFGQGYYGVFFPWPVAAFLPALFIPDVVYVLLWRLLTAGCLWYLAQGRAFPYLLALTSPPGLMLMRNANLDAVLVSGTLTLAAPAAWILVSAKPQVTGGVGLLLLRQFGWWATLPAIAIVALSTLIWPEWIERAMAADQGLGWGFSFFPWLVPVGLVMLWRSWSQDDKALAACATPFIFPYAALHSLAPGFAILASRFPRLASGGWLIFWTGLIAYLGV